MERASFGNIAVLNDFSIDIIKRIKLANKKQMISAKRYANAQLQYNAYLVFQDISYGYNENRSLSKKLERKRQQCIQMGIFAFCRDFFGYLLSKLKPTHERLIDEVISSIYNYHEEYILKKSIPIERNGNVTQTFIPYDGSLTASIDIRKVSNQNTEPLNIKLYMNKIEDKYQTKSSSLQKPAYSYFNFDSYKLLPRSELNEDTILLLSNLMKNLIELSLERKGYAFFNVPHDIFNVAMSDAFREFKNSIYQVINQDLYASLDSLVLEYLYSYYYFACKHIEVESKKLSEAT
ncbi:hypothetical protein OIY81_497 [Cryptosporidium canis]|uniref:Uncharacterized protein n=1 Tax=Cryptosporidium canis TaxID=195482 RepID=A0ABQ8P764_9CRYT|nr:hypothetical protein OJ252_1825 [Cryptosporidium canis]KAJ1614441.1 hypothetical protein OIY81_497 [Cryptosporidium canis]